MLLNNSNLACILGEGADKIRKLREKLPPWVIVIGIAGRDILPEERVEVQKQDISDITEQFRLKLVSEVPGAKSEELLDILLRPSREPYWKLGFKGGCQDIFFLSTLDKTPGFIKTMYSLVLMPGDGNLPSAAAPGCGLSL